MLKIDRGNATDWLPAEGCQRKCLLLLFGLSTPRWKATGFRCLADYSLRINRLIWTIFLTR